MLAETVTMAVKGHHYFKMTKNLLEVDRFQQNLEKLASTFEEKVRELSEEDLEARLAELRAYRDNVVSRLRTRYRRVDVDFRAHAEEAVSRYLAFTEALLSELPAR